MMNIQWPVMMNASLRPKPSPKWITASNATPDKAINRKRLRMPAMIPAIKNNIMMPSTT